MLPWILMIAQTIIFVILFIIFALRTRRVLQASFNWTDTVKNVTAQLNALDKSLNQEEVFVLEKTYNKKSLTELVEKNESLEVYKPFITSIAELVQDLYSNYRFLRQDPAEGDKLSGTAIMFTIHNYAYPEEFENLFRYAIDNNLSEATITKEFAKLVAEGAVLDLGGAEVNIGETGVSSIYQSNDTLTVMITYMTPEYSAERDAYIEELKAKEAEQEDVAAERLAEAERLRDLRLAAYKQIEASTLALNTLTAESTKDVHNVDKINELLTATKELLEKIQ